MNILHTEDGAVLSMPWVYHDPSKLFDVHVYFCEYFTLLAVQCTTWKPYFNTVWIKDWAPFKYLLEELNITL
jgi:hypothetical protein